MPGLIRVAPGELTCLECGETFTGRRCPVCGSDDKGKPRKVLPPAVPTVSYLRDGEYVLIA